MARDFTTRRRAILGGVICLVVADLALAAYSYQLTSEPQSPSDFPKLERQLKTLKASVARAEQIRQDMPKTQQDCEKFERMLLPASAGYSSLSSEIIEGEYINLILFLIGLQRYANIYEVESLALAPPGGDKGPANVIKVGLHLKTYFRTAA